MQNITDTLLKCAGEPTLFGVFDPTYAPQFLLYSYIPIIIASIALVFLILVKTGIKKEGLLLSGIIFSFIFWVINIIVTWLAVPVLVNNFSWQIIALFEVPIFIFTVLFVANFVNKKLNIIEKVIIFAPYVIVLILLPTKLNILSYDILNCQANIGILWKFIYFIEPIYAVLILSFLIRLPKKITQNILLIISSAIFLIIFWISNFWGELSKFYEFNLVGPLGVLIFISFLTFLIVRFKAFDIKLIGAQALVWALVILVGSQFFYQANMPISSLLLTAITLLVSAIVGLVIVRGVKKEIALREELEIANNNQQSLIHFISHQIKGFFTKSKMIFSGLLEGDFGEVPPVVLEMAKTGLDSDNNAVAMVQDILGASNLKTGTTDYNFKLVDLTMIVKKVAENFKVEMEKKGLKFETDISNVPMPAMVDETQITQVFKNLMDNSLRYTPSGEIKVSLQPNPDDKKKALFAIKDTGVGLSDKDKAKLFTEGGKGEESLKVNTNSTGYGLYIVRKIVETHKGKIWAESAGRGHGSKFLVELKLVE